MAKVPGIEEIDLRIDQLVVALKVAPERSDLKLLLSLYTALRNKVK